MRNVVRWSSKPLRQNLHLFSCNKFVANNYPHIKWQICTAVIFDFEILYLLGPRGYGWLVLGSHCRTQDWSASVLFWTVLVLAECFKLSFLLFLLAIKRCHSKSFIAHEKRTESQRLFYTKLLTNRVAQLSTPCSTLLLLSSAAQESQLYNFRAYTGRLQWNALIWSHSQEVKHRDMPKIHVIQHVKFNLKINTLYASTVGASQRCPIRCLNILGRNLNACSRQETLKTWRKYLPIFKTPPKSGRFIVDIPVRLIADTLFQA
jgi:hypothetical protein